ncbi:MAG: chitobiase/beta-hexosaminidase C-terminal domain-containing protein, partial [Armatimonadetes bacterium]|nr:chitobiase/beta-hexosaminidase C-terminal domain-containing protein [Armatimonadota bacterium]
MNNTIVGNTADWDGGGIYCSSSSATIANNIVAFNYFGMYLSVGALTIRNNDVYGNARYNYSGTTDPTGTNGNMSVDPKLASATYGNVHIQPDSPCVDAGEDSVVQPGWLDTDGQARVQGAHADVGADESDGSVWAAGPYCVVRVSAEGNDANDGSSWLLAKRTVQAAINAASGRGGDVWVKAGVYNERITLGMYAYVYGGFGGSETARTQRNWRTNETVLDGGGAGSVVTAIYGHVFSGIDGFTIRNGRKGAFSDGGGIWCFISSPTISNNRITGNTSDQGGGIYIYNSAPAISNNFIGSNVAEYWGGGIYCDYGSCPTIANNLIAGNSAPGISGGLYGYGGGIYCYGGSHPVVANNTISGNTATVGGGLDCEGNSSPTVSNNLIVFGSSGVSTDSISTPVLRNNDVYGNTLYDYSGISPGTGDISADPLFVNRTGGDYHLSGGSPCINAGDDSVVQPGWLDMDEEPRIYGPHVDIGADEYQGIPWVARPAFAPDGGTYISPQNVSISCATPDAVIHYTTDGVDPTESDPVVTGPVLVDRSMTLKARAYKTDWPASDIKSAVYTLKVATPTFSPDGGVYSVPQDVTITCATQDAVIHYTTNGVDPTESDLVATGPVPAANGMTLKARGYKSGWLASDVKSAVYTIARLADRKKQANGASVSISRAVVSGAFSGLFYVESDDRTCGIRVQLSGHTLSAGMRADVSGLMKTNPYG